jgi:thymidylate synthase (FAD)
MMWSTPDPDQTILYMARVSNPKNQDSPDTKLIRYLMQHGHVSPFEMASACVEIVTSRAISRQIIRHRSFSFQEFSQRYASVDSITQTVECRLQDKANRQSSNTTHDIDLINWWEALQRSFGQSAAECYKQALEKGIAKEQARALLPEGLTQTTLYMSGTYRSWIHYLQQRLDPSTQKEHQLVARQVLKLLREEAPLTMEAFFDKEIEGGRADTGAFAV